MDQIHFLPIQLDEQLRQMAGFAPEGQDASAPGGITNLTQLLGGDDTDADKGMDVLGLTSNLQQPSTQQQQPPPRGPGMAYSMNDMEAAKATPGGTSLNNAMNQKVVLAQINQHPTTAGYKSEASGGLPNLQAAMAKKAGDKTIPAPPPSLPNPDVFSPHSSLPVITTPTMPDQGASGGVTFDKATGGKQPRPVPSPRLSFSAPNDAPNLGVTFEQATNAKKGGLASPPQQQQAPASTNGATLGLGLSLQQAMNGKGAPLPAITPPPNRRKGVGMMLDSDMADQGVPGQKMGKSVSVDQALSSLAKPNIADAPGSPGFSPRRASMAEPRDTVTMINEGGRTPRGKGAMNLQEAMHAKGGSAAAAHESRGKTLNEVMSAKTGQLPRPESPRGNTLNEVMAGKTGQVLPPPDSTRGMTLNEVMAGKTGQPAAATAAPSSGRGMNLREAMAAKTGKTADRKRGYDSVEEAMAGKFAAAPRKLSKQLPNLPPVSNNDNSTGNSSKIELNNCSTWMIR